METKEGMETRLAKQTKAAKAQKQTNEERNSNIGIQLPCFTYKDPSLWFIQVNALFKLVKIVEEEQQFYHIVRSLPESVLANCIDVIEADFEPGKLKLLKDTLTKRYTPSHEERIREVLDVLHYDPTETPSNFFRKLISTSGGALPYELIVQRFKDRLPISMSAAITPMTKKIIRIYGETRTRPTEEENTMLEVADAIQSSQTNVESVSYHNRTSSRRSSVSSNCSNKSRTGRRGHRRFRPNGSWCKNHFNYRERAWSCGRPDTCKFKPRKQHQPSSSTTPPHTPSTSQKN